MSARQEGARRAAMALLSGLLGCGSVEGQHLSGSDSGRPDSGKYCDHRPRSVSCASGPLIESIRTKEAVLVDGRLLKLQDISYLETVPIANLRILDGECNFMIGIRIKEGSFGGTTLPDGGKLVAFVRTASADGVEMQIQRDCERACVQTGTVSRTLKEGDSVPLGADGLSMALEELNGALGWAKLSISGEGPSLWNLHIPEADYSFADLWRRKLEITVSAMDLVKREADVHVRVEECSAGL